MLHRQMVFKGQDFRCGYPYKPHRELVMWHIKQGRRTRNNGHMLKQDSFSLDIRKTFFPRKDRKTVEQVAQTGGVVSLSPLQAAYNQSGGLDVF